MPSKNRNQDALGYHSQEPKGKIAVVATKPVATQGDLALAYSPGVAVPCLAIAENIEDVYKYTAKGNLVGVISNGTAVLGLGNIGPEASKPVMEGKGVLFKKFAGIDIFDIEIAETDADKFIEIVKSLEPTFGGINLEDIKAPESFKIETELKKKMKIPVMHDDQHGTAIISAAALLNALIVVKKKIENIQIVINGAGGAAIACAQLYISLGASRKNIVMFDSKGAIDKYRENIDPTKAMFATDRKLRTLSQAMVGADLFVGLSIADVLTAKDVQAMADNPIVFALSNPDPEIAYDLAMSSRSDIVMATGRSDYPNQVNNVLGFPYIFRGALDVRATAINEEMKLAAVKAIAELAKENVPEMVIKAYGDNKISFGKEYLIPKPIDPRLITSISPAVAKAAIASGVARIEITDWEAYDLELQHRIGIDQKIMSRVISRARSNPRTVVFAEADHPKILKAAQMLKDDGVAHPILLGNHDKIKKLLVEYDLDLECPIIDPDEDKERTDRFANELFEKRKRKGVTRATANQLARDGNYFGCMMVELGDADAFISGLTNHYSTAIKPALQVIGMEKGINRVAGMYIIMNSNGTYFFADTTVNVNPTAEELVDIIGLTSNAVRFFDREPRMAVLSYSNFGSSEGNIPKLAQKAVLLAKEKFPDLIIDGDLQANVALDKKMLKEAYPFSELCPDGANTLIFPDLTSGNIAYKLLMQIGNADAIGPILLGMNKPVHVLQLGSSVREIYNMAAIAVVDAQYHVSKN
ncbi:MAG: NADP-dependent malic enzyme [Bacteroidetes bacterium]|nr:NADP-dependent malic enzyme [Bacteroidota bacterium]MDA1119434.1 NADP-dependent malic enzyme [Bacteroidota bacterium]